MTSDEASLRGGLLRVLGPPAPVVEDLAARGWEVAVVPPARDDRALWDGFVDALALPGWFGRNLDALDEVLRDRGRPTALVLAAWWAYATARPERWRRLLALLEEQAAELPPLLVVLAD